jgi:hypothetical protein
MRFGSNAVLSVVDAGEDQRFSKYTEPKKERVGNLLDAIERVRNDITAQCDPEAVNVHDACKRIGGRIQVATIKPAEGFRWIAGP